MRMHVSGGLTAPDPNRPFLSRPTPTPPRAAADTTSTHAGASRQSSSGHQRLATTVQQANQYRSDAAVTGSHTGPGLRMSATGGAVGAGLVNKGGRAGPQDRVLAKLGLSSAGHALKAGQQASSALQSTAPPSGKPWPWPADIILRRGIALYEMQSWSNPFWQTAQQ